MIYPVFKKASQTALNVYFMSWQHRLIKESVAMFLSLMSICRIYGPAPRDGMNKTKDLDVFVPGQGQWSGVAGPGMCEQGT